MPAGGLLLPAGCQENLPIPWAAIAAVFIGGSSQWKGSEHVVHIIKAAQALGKWTHVGRVNHAARFRHFEDLGVDFIDGTGLARYTHMRRAIANRDDQLEFAIEPKTLTRSGNGRGEEGAVFFGCGPQLSTPQRDDVPCCTDTVADQGGP